MTIDNLSGELAHLFDGHTEAKPNPWAVFAKTLFDNGFAILVSTVLLGFFGCGIWFIAGWVAPIAERHFDQVNNTLKVLTEDQVRRTMIEQQQTQILQSMEKSMENTNRSLKTLNKSLGAEVE
jgi:hypothetical protein